MADVAHFFGASAIGYFDAFIACLEAGVGGGAFPIQPDYSSIIFENPVDIDAVSLDDIWIGINFDASPGDGSVVQQWDGAAKTWIRHYWNYGTRSHSYIAVDGSSPPTKVWVLSSSNGSPWTWLRYWDGYTWTNIWLDQDPPTAQALWLGGRSVPTLYGNGILFTNTGGYGSGVRLWLADSGGATQYVGGDLPTGAMYGVAIAGTDCFVLNANGYVYRGSFTGGWTIDNAADGPFSGFSDPRSLRTSNTGQILCPASGGLWVRNGANDWTFISSGDSAGQVFKIDDHIVHRRRYSSNNGATWAAIGNFWDYPVVGGVKDEGSTGKRLLACGPTRQQRGLRWRGDHPLSPWAIHPYDPINRLYTAGDYLCMEGFPSGEIIISTSYFPGGSTRYYETWHFNPESPSTTWGIVSTTNNRKIDRIFGTAYEAGRIHGIAIVSGQIHYMRWNGSNWDDIPVPGSSSVGGNERINISATPDGQHIWITAGVLGSEQLWHSSNGGSTWTNRYSAAAAVHTSGVDWPIDVVAVSSTLAYVAFTGAVPGVGISKWNGSTWAKVGDPPYYVAVGGGGRTIFVDDNGELWLFGSGSTSNPIYKWTG